MKKIIALALVFATVSVFADEPYSIDISKSTPVDIDDVNNLRGYANTNNYYLAVNLRAGMRVLYSASYGVGNEAGQAAGTLVEKDGSFFFKQSSNPTNQLLLPPGLPFNSGTDVSLWDVGAYMELINRVAFSDPNTSSRTNNNVYSAIRSANIVDFKGGTAGASVTYKDALEVNYNHQVATRSDSNLKIYYARGIGPVALEFRESMVPSGTFKIYVGE
ncbi:hypothetical protein K2X33_04290 [bacterium]|nr:hypothetical protein [bacterium]